MSGSKVFSLKGKGLKLTTAEDIEPHLKELKENEDVETVEFLGNTIGIGASEALAKVLETKKKLQVCLPLLLFIWRYACATSPLLPLPAINKQSS